MFCGVYSNIEVKHNNTSTSQEEGHEKTPLWLLNNVKHMTLLDGTLRQKSCFVNSRLNTEKELKMQLMYTKLKHKI